MWHEITTEYGTIVVLHEDHDTHTYRLVTQRSGGSVISADLSQADASDLLAALIAQGVPINQKAQRSLVNAGWVSPW